MEPTSLFRKRILPRGIAGASKHFFYFPYLRVKAAKSLPVNGIWISRSTYRGASSQGKRFPQAAAWSTPAWPCSVHPEVHHPGVAYANSTDEDEQDPERSPSATVEEKSMAAGLRQMIRQERFAKSGEGGFAGPRQNIWPPWIGATAIPQLEQFSVNAGLHPTRGLAWLMRRN